MTHQRKQVPKPPWCGGCDERTRLADTPGETRALVYRCPVCHPLAKGPVAAAYRAAHQEEETTR